MTAFDESRHARDRSGKFAAHVGTEQQGALSEQEPDQGQATKEFPEWEKPWAARPEHYAELWADDLEVPQDSPEWQAQYAQNLKGLRDLAAAHAAGLYGQWPCLKV